MKHFLFYRFFCHRQSDYIDDDDYHDDDADHDDGDDDDDDEDFHSNYCSPMFPWLVERANLMFTFITTLLSRQSVDFHFNGRSVVMVVFQILK